jgi:hypothetical protein
MQTPLHMFTSVRHIKVATTYNSAMIVCGDMARSVKL